ncbi:hypothetical protein HHL23_20665 [Chryseobacterium sp. RP-3-3]|uniref:DUF8202 domain-containing protein n=1 Tax=Chryseobacterium antibioticum TaxID=2728847 RepID=A0A7Y0FTY7_9FLAO|nr:hypothetical protein [Chryseobacterium antibioticum]NML72181.1 hypothetical protein [Chryseobacterium antibioticum]
MLFISIMAYSQSPGGVPGAAAWYKGDAGLTSPAWTDQSGNGYNLTGANAPTSSYMNYNPVATFNGTNQQYSNTGLKANWPVGSSAHTYYYVARQTDNAVAVKTVLGIGVAGNLTGFNSGRVVTTGNIGTSGNLDNNTGTSGVQVTPPPTWQTNSTNLVRTGHNAAGSAPNYISANGGTEYTGANHIPTYLNTSDFRVGAAAWFAGNGLQFWAGDIAEVIVYPGKHTVTDYNKVESYLSVKYGITKNGNYVSSSATVWDAGNNNGYNNNIAGIARDNISGLHQKQSRSSNAGQQVLIGAGGALADNNGSNINTLTDGQSLIWGDNGLNKGLATIINGISGVNFRFVSIWKVQNTGLVGMVRVMWPQGLTNLKLIQSTDAVFDGTDTVTDMSANTQTINGVTYNYADVTLGDAQYFTFAAFSAAPGGVIAGLGYWYDAGVTATATSWSDKVNGFTINKNGTGPTVISSGDKDSNFNPFYTFSSTNYAHFTGAINPAALGRLHTTFAMGSKSGNIEGTYNHIFRFGSAAGSAVLHRYAVGLNTADNQSTLHYIDSGGAVDRRNTNYNALFNQMTLVGAQISAITGSNNKQVGYNGNYLSFTDAITADVHPNLQIGGSFYGFAGRIPEVVYYNTSLGLLDRSKVNSYLALKYGVTLIQPMNYVASNGDLVWDSSINTLFNNNIFGIGKDVAGSLDQKVSNSINPITVGKLTVATIQNFTAINSNVSRTSLNDTQYLVFGDNNNNNTATTFLDPNACPALQGDDKRIAKTWEVKNTNDANATWLEVDMQSYDITKDVFLLVGDDAALTSNTYTIPGTISGGKAVFNVKFTGVKYFTVGGKVGTATCETCKGGKQVLQTALAWYNGGVAGMTSNNLTNVALNGTAPSSGALSANIGVSYPANVEWIPTIFPRWYGKWAQLSRYDNVSGAAGKVTYTVDLKDAIGTKAAKTSFQIAGITKISGQSTVVKVTGYCGGTAVLPKMNYAYNSTPANNSYWRRYSIDASTATVTGTQPYYEIYDIGTVNVNFEKVVDKVVIEWTVDRSPVFKTVNYLYISDMTYVCDNPVEPTPDNVNIIASYVESQLPTCEEGTLKLDIRNNNCSSKTIDLSNTLPAGLEYVANSYVGLGTETPTYSGLSFQLNDLVLPSGISYIYVKVKPTNPGATGTYSTHFTYTVDGGINTPTPYRSDDDSGQSGYQDTSILYTASAVTAKPTIIKTVNRCFGTSSTELEYTVTIKNNDSGTINNVEFADQLDGSQTYILGSLAYTNFVSNGLDNSNDAQVYISGMSIAAGQTATITFKVNTNNAYTMAYTDVSGNKYINNMASVIIDPQSACGSSSSTLSNELKVLACTFCTKDPNTLPADLFTKIGITIQSKQNGWPENLPNGAVALESKTKGFVITRTVSSLVINPVEGMIIYDTTDKCIKMYNGSSWNCVARSCND